jgi:hypothetical protein
VIEKFASHFIHTMGSVTMGSGREGQNVDDGADLVKDVGLDIWETNAFFPKTLSSFRKTAIS